MDAPRTVFPDIITSRLEDLANAPLPGEEAPQYFDTLYKAQDALLELVPADAREQVQARLTEMTGLNERLRQLYVRFAYVQGLQDGVRIKDVLQNGHKHT